MEPQPVNAVGLLRGSWGVVTLTYLTSHPTAIGDFLLQYPVEVLTALHIGGFLKIGDLNIVP